MIDSVATEVQSSAPASTQFLRHRGPVTCVAAVPNTNLAVTSGYDGAVGLFNLETGAVDLLGYHGHLVNRIIVNREGTRAASSSSDYDIYLWNLQARTVARVLRGHSDDVEDFSFVNENTGVSVSRDQRILVWDLNSGAVVRTIEEHEKDVLSVVSDGDSFFTSGDDMTLRQWDLKTGRMLRKWGPFEHETDTCAIDTVQQRAVLGCDDGAIRIFSIRTGELVREIPAHASGIKKVCTSPANGDILSAAYDQRIRIWDAHTLEPKIELARVPSTWERSLNWAPDGASILAGTFDGTVLVWDAETGRLSKHVGDLESAAGNACFNEASATPAGDLAVVSDDGYIRLATLTPSAAAWRSKTEPASGRILMNAITLDAAGKRVLAGTHDHRLLIYDWDGKNLSHEKSLALGEGPINSIRVAHNPGYDADAFVACYSGAVVQVTPDGKIKNKIRHHEGAVKALRIHPSQPLGVSCGADGLLLSWGLDGKPLKRFAGHTAIVDDVDIDPSGKMIASAGRDFVLKIHSIETGELLHAIRIGRRSPKSICFLDEKTVVIGDYWGALICVDLESEKVSRKQIARNGISSLSRSGDYLVATSYDGSIYLVRASDWQVVNTLTAMTQRLQENGWCA
jgi:WD40 repeat protein